MDSYQEDSFNWQELVNKPVYTVDRKSVGVLSSIQAEKFIVIASPVSPKKFLIPKSSIQSFQNGLVNIKEELDYVNKYYQFE